ncbi:ATP-binding protein [Dyadobacter sp. CY261]|uniref:ATP-binding protein n=1 Tax=Dyadobacter sp. CY261 TaxID=2907203 RepID=UPI001F218E12|nr:ATP-binding protein [Dyadobacter sp. CY261]MCF0069593.1 ATP-binding protein [Dyadobacter sp. CY261]
MLGLSCILLLFAGHEILSAGALPDSGCRINGEQYEHLPDTLYVRQAVNELFLELPQYPLAGVSYAFRMEPIDTEWIPAIYPAMRYETLKKGLYELHFRVLDANGKVFKTSSFVIRKEAAFWNAWWFIPLLTVYVLVVAGVGIYIFSLYNFRQKLKVQYLRNQIASDLHDEVGSNLNSIALFVELLRKNASPDNLPILDRIISNSKESVELMQDTVWAINPRNDSLQKLIDKMHSFAAQVTAASDIELEFQAAVDFDDLHLSMEQRKNIYLIFKEAVNNVVKHAGATQVTIRLNRLSDAFFLKIEDNGKGFDTGLEYEGNGISNLKKRAEESGLDLLLHSRPGEGTRVEVLCHP